MKNLAAFTAIVFLVASTSLADDTSKRQLDSIFASFEKGDPGWQTRMRSLVQVARIGQPAVANLIEALKAKSARTREFAAQALAMFGDTAAREALEQSLDDKHTNVRIYALRALSMMGSLKPTEKYEKFANRDPNFFGVRMMAQHALDRKDKPNPEALRNAWAQYDLSKLGSARAGELAPDFSLAGFSGKTHQLRDFRGKTVVILYFQFDY